MSGNSINNKSGFARAVFFIILAILFFDIQGAIIKHMGDRYSVQQIASYRNLFGLIPCLITLIICDQWQAGDRSLKLRQWKLAVFRGLSIAVAQSCFYWSLVIMEFATASTLAFAGPLFITALSVPLLGNRVGLIRWVAVFVGFVGIVLVMRPRGDVFELTALLPVGAAFGYGLTSVLVKLFDDNAETAIINFWTTCAALFFMSCLMVFMDAYQPVASATDWMWLILMGMVGGFAVFFMIVAYRLTQPSNLSPFEYFGIPFSFAIGYLIFNEAPFGKLFPGVIFIVAGGLLIVWRERTKTSEIVTQAKVSKRY